MQGSSTLELSQSNVMKGNIQFKQFVINLHACQYQEVYDQNV